MANWVIICGRYAQKTLVFRGVPLPVITWPQVSVPLNSRPVAFYRKGGTTTPSLLSGALLLVGIHSAMNIKITRDTHSANDLALWMSMFAVISQIKYMYTFLSAQSTYNAISTQKLDKLCKIEYHIPSIFLCIQDWLFFSWHQSSSWSVCSCRGAGRSWCKHLEKYSQHWS